MSPTLRFRGFNQDWLERPMGELLSFKNGYNAEKAQYGSGVKFINVLDIIENDFITHDKIIGSVEIPKKDFEKNEVRYGDLLFQRSSETREEVGQTNVYLDRERSATFGGFVIRGRPLEVFDSIFFNEMLKTTKPRNDVTSRSGGSTRYNIGQESLESVLVHLAPTVAEQRKIADFLTAVDGRIGQLRQKKALLEEYKKGVMQQLFTQTLRFKDDHGNAFPDWETRALGDVVEVNPKSPSLPESFVYIDLESVNAGILHSPRRILKADAPSRAQRLLQKGDILYQTVRPYQMNNYFFDREDSHVASTGYAQLRASRNCARFVYHFLHLSSFVGQVMDRCTGTSYPAINSNDLAKIHVPLPCIAEQTKIANFLTALDQKIESAANQITHTQIFKKGLLQQLFV